ncbi:MAG: hypothetical protein FJ348_04025 [Sphingomonadales bacterium]|nr:hypothetical protein [Sphingomonadales bacterium]
MKVSGSVFFMASLAALSVAFSSCTKKAEGRPDFELIQEQILTPTCAVAGCHASTADATYTQHKLLLTEGQAWDELINQTPQNSAAAVYGLKLVKPGASDLSLLYHKITCETGHHPALGNIGAPMPLGGQVLSKGQVEFIKQWIDQGASKTGSAVDDALLKDNSPCQAEVQPLTPPAAGTGFQMTISPFDIPKNFEREVFVRKNSPNTDTVFVNRLQMRGGNNSHHFVVYGFRNSNLLPALNVLRDLRDPVTGTTNSSTLLEMQNHVFMGGGTDVNTDITLPTGVAIKMAPGTPVDLNAHYFNRTLFTLTGQNYINFYTVPRGAVQYEAKTLDLNNFEISIPANTRRTFTKNFTFSALTRVVMLTSHFHKMGERFVIKIFGGPRNGEVVYTNTSWEHPLVLSYATPIILQPGQGLTSEVTYFNNTSQPVSFGLTSQDEMNIIFGYYY